MNKAVMLGLLTVGLLAGAVVSQQQKAGPVFSASEHAAGSAQVGYQGRPNFARQAQAAKQVAAAAAEPAMPVAGNQVAEASQQEPMMARQVDPNNFIFGLNPFIKTGFGGNGVSGTGQGPYGVNFTGRQQ